MSELFGNDTTNPTLVSLNSKYHYRFNQSAIVLAAHNQNICGVERKNDVSLIVNNQYTKKDGTPMLFAVPECPRSYYLAYVVKKGWPFTKLFNQLIIRLFEAGFLTKWYKDTEMAIIAQNLIRNPPIKENYKAYSMYDMQIGFYIIIVGSAFSCVILIVEAMTFYLFKNEFKKI